MPPPCHSAMPCHIFAMLLRPPPHVTPLPMAATHITILLPPCCCHYWLVYAVILLRLRWLIVLLRHDAFATQYAIADNITPLPRFRCWCLIDAVTRCLFRRHYFCNIRHAMPLFASMRYTWLLILPLLILPLVITIHIIDMSPCLLFRHTPLRYWYDTLISYAPPPD